ncbi:VWA domain-containing protein [Endozoicomonas ascidiicola]|uniref:VWA domain-containing protein n=1 Tax=Endozoicomonas ascidiicola TaxID=1698521 RepID=UPI000A805FFB|nr:VWA domain-containing protein [Endozoicomonas ascidiicola]
MNLSTKEPDSESQLMRLSDLENRYSLYDQLPESLFAPVLTNPIGQPLERVQGVLQLREHLLKGMLPQPIMSWPSQEMQQGLIKVLEHLNIARFCYDNNEVTDALIADILTALEEQNGQYLAKYQALVTLLTKQEQAKQKQLEEQKTQKKKKGKQNKSILLNSDSLAAIEAQAREECFEDMFAAFGHKITGIWSERMSVWNELETVFRDLQLVVRLGYDLSKGLFQSHGWLNLVKLRELLGKLPQLQKVIQTLGRMQETDGEPEIQKIMELVRRNYLKDQEVKTPHVPMEIGGVTRSDSISRMLPQEAALLTHPTLKKLWHAKRAEQALLSYSVEGIEIKQILVEEEVKEESTKEGRSTRFEKGPVIICLDTSGSMRGSPEDIAKALVLETLRVASSEKRDCYVYLFGSTNEIKELELSGDAKGMDRLISFLSMSFGGGTDVQRPVLEALERCKKEQWKKADLLIVSDGEFPTPDNFVDKVKRRGKSHGLRVHGVLIGDYGRAMERICDPVHRFSEWGDLL